MKHLMITLTVIAAAVVTVLILNRVFRFEISRFFIARPNITFDAAEEYNRVTKPENFDPAQNAAPLYERALKSLTPMPEFLKDMDPVKSCVDLTEQQTGQLKDWIAENSNAFDLFRQAAKKPYCWIEINSSDEMVTETTVSIKDMSAPFCWQIRHKASEGDILSALDDSILLLKVSNHFTSPECLIVQLVGAIVRRKACEMAFSVLDLADPKSNELTYFQKNLRQALDVSNPVFLYSQGELVYVRDWIQKAFTDDGRGNGRLIPSEHLKFDFYETWYGVLFYALMAPDRRKTEQFSRNLPGYLKPLYELTPYQIHQQNDTYKSRISRLWNRFDHTGMTSRHIAYLIEFQHKMNVNYDALLAVVAILRYQKENGSFPQSLQQLVDVGYLRAVPMDPYSDGPLVYRAAEDDFLLYSVGEDFTDNGGTPLSDRNSETDGYDDIFWPNS